MSTSISAVHRVWRSTRHSSDNGIIDPEIVSSITGSVIVSSVESGTDVDAGRAHVVVAAMKMVQS